jgi:hypothetical protein
MDNQKAKLKKTGSKINGEKMESQKGKKKGKKWVEKNRSNKKGEKKRKTKETPM